MKNLTELTKGLVPPRAEIQPSITHHHGHAYSDNYAWLKPTDWAGLLRGNAHLEPAILDYLIAENDYSTAALASTVELQKELVAEMRARMQEEDVELPEKDGPFEYYWRYREGAEHPQFYRIPVLGGDEECLLNAAHESQDHVFFELGDFEVSPDHQLLAWSCDIAGSELYQLRFRCLSTGDDLPHVIRDVDTVTWLSDDTILYVSVDAGHHANQVWRYVIGSDPQAAQLVFDESDPAFELAVGRMRSGEYVEIVASSDGQDEIWLIETNSEAAQPRLFEPRAEGLEYSVDHRGDQFFILTNAFGATDFQIMVTARDDTGRANWQTWLPARQGVMLLSMDCYRDWIVWMEQRDALPQLYFSTDDGDSVCVEFSGAAYELDYDLSPEFDSQHIRFSFESPSTPLQTWEYDLATQQRRLLKQTVIPSGHEPTNFVTTRLYATSEDGTQVPVTCISHRDTAIDGSALCVLEGYGSYGTSLDMGFDAQRVSLLERGVVYALAHVRGGSENGQSWYYAARGAEKKLSVDDYLACIDCLIAEGYSSTAGVVGLGRSAGGLLIGAAINRAPERFAGAIADVPFVDVLNTMLDDSHPLTPGEWVQWGNPITNPAAYRWIAQWSPYDNVVPQSYPVLLVTTAIADSRVGYWEAAKWVARIRSLAKPEATILLRTDMQTGHSGSAGRFDALRAIALECAFILLLDNDRRSKQTV